MLTTPNSAGRRSRRCKLAQTRANQHILFLHYPESFSVQACQRILRIREGSCSQYLEAENKI